MKQKKYKYKPTPEERNTLFEQKKEELEMCIRSAKDSMDQYIMEYKALEEDDFSEIDLVANEGDEGYENIDAPETNSDAWLTD